MKEIGVDDSWEEREIKSKGLTKKELTALYKMAGSYEALFSRRSMKYRAWKLNEMDLKEKDYEKYILEEYTFLKRPVVVLGDDIFIGNTKKTVAAIIDALR